MARLLIWTSRSAPIVNPVKWLCKAGVIAIVPPNSPAMPCGVTRIEPAPLVRRTPSSLPGSVSPRTSPRNSSLRNRDRHERPCAVTETQARVLDGKPDVAGGVLFEGDAAGQLLAEDSEGDVRSTHLHAGFERERLAPEAHRLVGRRRVDPDVERAAHEHVGHVHGNRGRQAAEDATTRPA